MRWIRSMNENPSRTAIVSFKVEAELAELLNQLPNKSEFIRQAISLHMDAPCPLCLGQGTVSAEIQKYFSTLLGLATHSCVACGREISLLIDIGRLSAQHRAPFEQFLMGGLLYCENCFTNARACVVCGRHIDESRMLEHIKSAHVAPNATNS